MSDIAEGITQIPAQIVDGLRGFFQSVLDAVLGIPDLILDGLKVLILPSDGYIERTIDKLYAEMESLGVQVYDMSGVFSKEKPFEDIKATINGVEVVMVDMRVVRIGVDYFRPLIRGFIVLMLVMYNLNQFFGLIGQQPITLGGNVGAEIPASGSGDKMLADNSNLIGNTTYLRLE